MSVVKIITVLGTSDESWEDAAQQAVTQASETIQNIQGVEVVSQTAAVDGTDITQYKTTVDISFEIEQ